jgi:hypothetical protein
VCRLSGLGATAECPRVDEWFAAGTAPTRPDDWERDGRVALPDEYAEWAREGLRTEGGGRRAAGDEPTHARAERSSESDRRTSLEPPTSTPEPRRLRILSPLDGDRYAIPAGIETRYATISLRAGGPGADSVQWSVDGKPFAGGRWPLAPGRHVVRAVSVRGQTAEARIVVER